MRTPISVVAVLAISVTMHANVSREDGGALRLTQSIQPVTGNTSKGYVVASTAGERLVYCGRPLVLNIKVDSKRAPGTRLIAGTAELRGDEGAATHRSG